MMFSDRDKRLVGKAVTYAGYILTVLSLFYVGLEVSRHALGLENLLLQPRTVGILVLSTTCYSALLLVMAAAWGFELSATTGQRQSAGPVFRVYARAQIMKYLPGNVAQLGYRQLLGAREGWPQGAIAASTAIEISLHAAAAAAITLIAVSFLNIAELPWKLPEAAVYLVLGAAAVGPILLVSLGHHIPFIRMPRRGTRRRLAFLGWSYLLLVLFVAGMAVAYWCILCALERNWHIVSLAHVAASFAVAWVVGYFAPGAPGGLGVREAILIASIGEPFSSSATISAVILLRLATIFADFAILLLSLFVARPSKA